MKLTLNELGQVLKNDSNYTGDNSFYGVVKSEIRDNENKITGYNVEVGDSLIEARKLSGAQIGDIVLVTTLSNGISVVTGCLDGDKDAAEAKVVAEEAKEIAENIDVEVEEIYEAAEQAQRDAEAAAEAANSVKQYFFHDDDGVHVATIEDDAEHGYNALLKAGGVFFRNALSNLMSLTTAALTFFNSTGHKLMQLATNALEFFDGTDDENSIAKFSGTEARVGKENDANIKLSDGDFDIYDNGMNLMNITTSGITVEQAIDKSTYMTGAGTDHLRKLSPIVTGSNLDVYIDETLVHTFTEGVYPYYPTGGSPYDEYIYLYDGQYRLRIRFYKDDTFMQFRWPWESGPPGTPLKIEIHYQRYNANINTTIGTRVQDPDSTGWYDKGNHSFTVGNKNTATEPYTVAIGNSNRATGQYSMSQGYDNVSSGLCSQAFGRGNNVNSSDSTAIGCYNHINGINSFAQGYYNIIDGDYAQALGYRTQVDGNYSHVAGQNLLNFWNGQTIFGKYNDNKANSILEIGNGTPSNRRNALELDASGNLTIAGILTTGSGGGTGDPIGTIVKKTGSSVKPAVSTSEYKQLSGAEITLNKGTWIISYDMNMDLNTSGLYCRGRLVIGDNPNPSSGTSIIGSPCTAHSSSGAIVSVNGTWPHKITSDKTKIMLAYQHNKSTSTAPTTSYYLYAVKIA